jgi:hypothetical protein
MKGILQVACQSIGKANEYALDIALRAFLHVPARVGCDGSRRTRAPNRMTAMKSRHALTNRLQAREFLPRRRSN